MSFLTPAIDELDKIWSALKAEGHTLAADVKNVIDKLKGDAPVIEHEAVADAEHVVATAETEGVKPAEAEAVADAAKVGADAVHDVEAAVTEAETPAAPSA